MFTFAHSRAALILALAYPLLLGVVVCATLASGREVTDRALEAVFGASLLCDIFVLYRLYRALPASYQTVFRGMLALLLGIGWSALHSFLLIAFYVLGLFLGDQIPA